MRDNKGATPDENHGAACELVENVLWGDSGANEDALTCFFDESWDGPGSEEARKLGDALAERIKKAIEHATFSFLEEQREG